MAGIVNFARRFVPEPSHLGLQEKVRVAALSLLSIMFAILLSQPLLGGLATPTLTASMGASALLLFVVPHSPLAQPWPFVGGHLVSALVGISCAKWIPQPLWAESIAVSVAILSMLMTRSLHPPAAATALMTATSNDTLRQLGYQFIFTPLLVNALALLLLALVINNLLSRNQYPAPLAKSNLHKSSDKLPSERLSYKNEDLKNALDEMNTVIDISQADLENIYQRTEMHAYRRKFGEVICKEIMSKDVISVEFGTELEEAWALLRKHKVKALPVVDKSQRVVGIITLVDFLKRANLKTYEGFEEKLIKFIRRTPLISSEKPEAVGQIMAHPVFTLAEDRHIVELVPLLSDNGLHHVPIVNSDRKLVGIITQSDLIAALYRGNTES